MLVKSSKSIIFTNENSSISGYNFLNGENFETEKAIFPFMEKYTEWTKIPNTTLKSYSGALEAGVLLEDNSKLGLLEKEFEEQWNIGLPAAVFHFSLIDRNYETLEYNKKFQQEKAVTTPSPSLYKKNNKFKSTIKLKKPNQDALCKIMQSRRSKREVCNGHTSLRTLSDLLFCSLRITDFIEGDTGKLPLKMVPSGGARNPYEAYIFSRNVEGLRPGIYHYSAFEHNLEKVAPLPKESLGSYVGNQDWADKKNALIFLVAYMERSMWKYEDPNIYRAIMIEAGHIAQNMMLIATRDKQTLCPTAALCHSKIMDAAKIKKKITRSPIYALALGPN